MRRAAGALGALVLLLSGCGGGTVDEADVPSVPAVAGLPESPSAEPLNSSCVEAVGQLEALEDAADREPDLRAVFDECGSVAELETAVEVHGDALDGTDPATYVAEQCEAEPVLADSVLCASPSLG